MGSESSMNGDAMQKIKHKRGKAADENATMRATEMEKELDGNMRPMSWKATRTSEGARRAAAEQGT